MQLAAKAQRDFSPSRHEFTTAALAENGYFFAGLVLAVLRVELICAGDTQVCCLWSDTTWNSASEQKNAVNLDGVLHHAIVMSGGSNAYASGHED